MSHVNPPNKAKTLEHLTAMSQNDRKGAIMKHYTTYLFDADGTILDTTELIVHCFKKTAQQFEKNDITEKDIKRYIGLPFISQCEKYFGPLSKEEALNIRNFHREYQLSVYADYMKLFPGTIELMKALKSAGKKIAIVTSRSRSTLDIYNDHFGISPYLDLTVTPEDVEKPKPDPQSCVLALKKLKTDPSDALFIGDAVFDEACAHGAGVDFALVSWTHQPKELFHHVSYQIDSFDNFRASIEKL